MAKRIKTDSRQLVRLLRERSMTYKSLARLLGLKHESVKHYAVYGWPPHHYRGVVNILNISYEKAGEILRPREFTL